MSDQPVAPVEKDPKKIEKWEVDSAVDTLLRAEEIKGNSALMKEVLKKIGEKKKAINSLAELRSVAQDKLKDE